ncbi:uncharacterized protein VTP21DRAFT_5666 [Calcarisporiella thermophila]|uniref:uncharacterized protein n=1 Tax=Calcarisporiella thermophila TaxID=911321 RepID=UPI0037429CB3
MRTISLVNRLKWQWTGNMNPQAIAIGDVDNDGDNEFVVGNLNGEMGVFKGESATGTPWLVCRDLGTITSIAVGDVLNHGKNSIVCISAEGFAHIFDIPNPHESTPMISTTADTPTSNRRRSSDTTATNSWMTIMEHSRVIERPSLKFEVEINVSRVVIADVNNDGLNEMILARTDYILHYFQLQMRPSAVRVASGPHPPASTWSRETLLRSGGGGNGNKGGSPSHEARPASRPLLLRKQDWIFDAQITSLTVAEDPANGKPLLVVGQPGARYMFIDSDGNKVEPTIGARDDRYEEVGYAGDQNDEEDTMQSTEVAWCKMSGEKQGFLGLITMDGRFFICDLVRNVCRQANLPVMHKLFGLFTLDVSDKRSYRHASSPPPSAGYFPPQGPEEGDNVFVACAWNGSTYFINPSAEEVELSEEEGGTAIEMVEFGFEGRVCAFAAGRYAVSQGVNVPCLFYVDFDDSIYVYHDVRLRPEPVTSFLEQYEDALREEMQQIEEFDPELTRGGMRPFVRQCLYNFEEIKEQLEREIGVSAFPSVGHGS